MKRQQADKVHLTMWVNSVMYGPQNRRERFYSAHPCASALRARPAGRSKLLQAILWTARSAGPARGRPRIGRATAALGALVTCFRPRRHRVYLLFSFGSHGARVLEARPAAYSRLRRDR